MERLSELLDRSSLYIALLAAWVAMLGSLYFSEVAGYIPCELCWYQRILMYPLAIILAVGLLRSDLNLPFYLLPLSTVGIGVSLYHYLLQKGIVGSVIVCQEGVPCTGIWINWLGFITIPFLALVAFLIITVMSFIAWQAEEPFREPYAPAPWRLVLGLIGLVLLAFAALAWMGNTPSPSDEVGIIVAAPFVTTTAMSRDLSLAEGKALYEATCADCHGLDRTGVVNMGNAINNTPFIAQRSNAELLAFLRIGRTAGAAENQSGLAMPPSGGRPDLSDAEMLAIIRYLRNDEM